MPLTAPPSTITPGFLLLQSNRLEVLRLLLIDWLKTNPLAPLENETVLVQSNGMAQWLKLGLATDRKASGGGLGIASGLEMLLPARLQWQCYRAILGVHAVPKDSPLDKDPLVWRLMRLLPDLLNEPDFSPLHHYVLPNDQPDNGPDERRLYQLALRLADQFDQYQVYRADWLLYWQQGHNALPPSEPSPGGTALDPEQLWQPKLWRAITADIQAQQPEHGENSDVMLGRAGLHQAFLQAANQHQNHPTGLPRRIIVFGLSSIAPQILDVLATIAHWTQVIVCLQNPCQHYWGDIIDGHQLFSTAYRGKQPRKLARADNPEDLSGQAHPLLAAWGRQGRDLMRLLDTFEDNTRLTRSPDNNLSNHLSLTAFESPCAAQSQPSLLSLIHDDILELRSPAELLDLQRRLMPHDAQSLQFHIAHSPLREVEILHDQLLAALEADASLTPTDIIVMVPDMSIYAPAIAAIFGRIDRSDPRFIPFTISDQTTGSQTPVINALDRLLRLPQARLGRSEVLDLLGTPLLRAKFGIKEADIPTLHTWIDAAGIRWGLDAMHREHFDLPPGITQNTWLFGLNRLLLGYLSGDSQAMWQGIEPYPAMDSISAGLIGYLADLINQLSHYTHVLAQPYTPEEWQHCLQNLMTDFFQEPDLHSPDSSRNNASDDLETHARLLTSLAQWRTDCHTAHFTQPINIDTVRHAWLDRLEPHRLQQRFLVGGVNFATLMPMRAIPYRQVYLLGMDDASYPRRQPPSDFDLMAARYRPGDRARREDDRYLFLEALLAAREKFVVSWVGRNINNNQTRPASVLVSQLHDYLDQFWHASGDGKASEHLTTHHPLHPYSRQYFSGKNPALFTYATDWRAIHSTEIAAQTTTKAPSESTTLSLPIWRPERVLSLNDLSKFLRAPAQLLFKERFGIQLQAINEDLEDHEPFELDGLKRWQIKHQLNDRVRQKIASAANFIHPTPEELSTYLHQQYHKLLHSGQFPIMVALTADEFLAPLMTQWQTWQTLKQHYEHRLPTQQRQSLCGNQGIALEAQTQDLFQAEDGHRARLIFIEGKLHQAEPTRPENIRRDKCVNQWPAHLFAQLTGHPVETHLIGETGTVRLPPIDEPTARHQLINLLDSWFDAIQQPYPIACKTAFCWLENHKVAPDQAIDKARICFEGGYNVQGEIENDPILARIWPNFDTLLNNQLTQNQRFTDLCQQLYQPIITALQKGNPPEN